jgi:hypothetical protein
MGAKMDEEPQGRGRGGRGRGGRGGGGEAEDTTMIFWSSSATAVMFSG